MCGVTTPIEANTPHHFFKDGAATTLLAGGLTIYLMLCVSADRQYDAPAATTIIVQSALIAAYIAYHTHVTLKNWFFPDEVTNSEQEN